MATSHHADVPSYDIVPAHSFPLHPALVSLALCSVASDFPLISSHHRRSTVSAPCHDHLSRRRRDCANPPLSSNIISRGGGLVRAAIEEMNRQRLAGEDTDDYADDVLDCHESVLVAQPRIKSHEKQAKQARQAPVPTLERKRKANQVHQPTREPPQRNRKSTFGWPKKTARAPIST